MPAGYTHYVFGEKVLNKLPEEYRSVILKNDLTLDAFHIGIHGPDILFYYNALKSNDVIDQGNTMHLEKGKVFFAHAKEVLKNNDSDAARSYVYGFICHFALDHACHPFIYEMQNVLKMTHSEIESDLDRKCLVLEGKDPLRTSLTTHIHPTLEVSEVIAPFFNRDAKTIEKALKDLIFYLGWIKAPGKIKRSFVYTAMKIGGIYDKHKGLLISYEENQKDIHEIQILIDKMNLTVDSCISLIERFDEPVFDEVYENNFE